MKSPPAISLPQGVRDILPEESAKINLIERSILAVFEDYGFERVITPMLEYLDVLSLGLDKSLKNKVVKFVDPSTGRVVGLRPDITPQVARIAATRMKESARPLKLSYNASVIRSEKAGGSKTTEILQIGAEHIANTSDPCADAEMVIMAIESLKALSIKDFKIDLGDVGFIRTILERLDLSHKDAERIRGAIAIKDTSGLTAVLDELANDVDDKSRRLLSGLTTLYGEEEVIGKALDLAGFDVSAKKSLDNLKMVVDIIEDKGYKNFITIDLGEIRGFDYYTGLIFEGFARGVGKPILNGGRYDNLLSHYGLVSASTGFAFDVERLLSAMRER